MCFFQQQSPTDLHAVACNLGKLNAGATIGAPHYRAHFALSTAADNLVLSRVTCVQKRDLIIRTVAEQHFSR